MLFALLFSIKTNIIICMQYTHMVLQRARTILNSCIAQLNILTAACRWTNWGTLCDSRAQRCARHFASHDSRCGAAVQMKQGADVHSGEGAPASFGACRGPLLELRGSTSRSERLLELVRSREAQAATRR